MAREEKCVTCGGTGHRWCSRCGGTGKEKFNPWVVSYATPKDCNRCKGSGRDPDPDPSCKGTGLNTVTNK
jgi:DnaJ-class molecular chaperone